MTDTLLIYLAQQDESQDGGDGYSFDTRMLAELLGADVGHAVTEDGTPVQFVGEERRETVYDRPYYVQSSTLYDSHFCLSGPDRFTPEVVLTDGERVPVAAYDRVLISHFWLHHSYLDQLLDAVPEPTYVGVQEESVQDVIATGSQLQAAHFDTLDRLDGMIAFNEQYRRWIEPHCRAVLRIPLPIPPEQFADAPTDAPSRGAVCAGVGTWNVDRANFYTNLRVVDRVRASGHDVDAEIVGIRDRQRGEVAGLDERFDHLSVFGYMDEAFYDHLAGLEFAVLTTTRATAGRVAAELAGLGVPCIGNEHNDMQARCWPDLTVDPYDTERAVELAERLLTDASFYREQTRRARTAVRDEFDAEETCAGLETFLRRVRAV